LYILAVYNGDQLTHFTVSKNWHNIHWGWRIWDIAYTTFWPWGNRHTASDCDTRSSEVDFH